MEKGFNDQELADIMSEIENLERELDETPATKEETPGVLHELAQKPQAESVPATNYHHAEKVVAMKKTDSPAPSSLSFKVEGQMTVTLAFEVNGQYVSLAVSDEGLSIETESGAKFTLPLSKVEAYKKAA